MISCILLSAGESLRFGSPKALADLGGKTVIRTLQETLIASRVDEIIVVVGASLNAVKPHILKHKKVKVVYNKDYNLGQTSSFKAGLQTVSPATQGIFLLPADFPLITTETVDHLIQEFLFPPQGESQGQPLILLPTHEGKKGHPPLFSARLRKELSDLDETLGVNTVVHRHPDETRLFPVEDSGVVMSFNTQEEFERIKELQENP